MATINQVIEATIRLVQPEFAAMTLNDRKRNEWFSLVLLRFIVRRADKDNIQKYVELSEEFAEQLDEIIYKRQIEIMASLGISEDTWEASNMFYMNQGSRELMMLHASIPTRLRYYL